MYPASLDENTIQFSSKKFTNNNVRDEIIATLNKYGPHEVSYLFVFNYHLFKCI